VYVEGSCDAIAGDTRSVEKSNGSSTGEWKDAVFLSVVVGESMEIVGGRGVFWHVLFGESSEISIDISGAGPVPGVIVDELTETAGGGAVVELVEDSISILVMGASWASEVDVLSLILVGMSIEEIGKTVWLTTASVSPLT